MTHCHCHQPTLPCRLVQQSLGWPCSSHAGPVVSTSRYFAPFAGPRQFCLCTGEGLPRISVWAVEESTRAEHRALLGLWVWQHGGPTGQHCGAVCPSPPIVGSTSALPIMWHPGQVTELCPVASVWQQVQCCPSSHTEPSGPTPCTAAATCAGSPAGSRQGTRSQALPAVLGPPTWKESCCSPPLPRNLSAKVRGAHAVHPYPPLGTQQSYAL